MRRAARKIAVLSFMLLAIIGGACDVPPLTCTWRALVGAAGVFLAARLAGRLVVQVLAQAAVHVDAPPKRGESEA